MVEVKDENEMVASMADETLPQEVAPLANMLRPYVLIRLRGQLTLHTENTAEAIAEEFAFLLKRVTSAVYTFHLENSGVYLRSEDEAAGLPTDGLVKHLAELKKKRKQDELVSFHIDSGFVSYIIYVLCIQEVLEATLLAKPAKFKSLGETDPISNCAPFVQHRKRKYIVVI